MIGAIILSNFMMNLLQANVEAYEKSVKCLHKWDVPLDVSETCYKFHMIQAHGVFLKVCTKIEILDKIQKHPFKTYIDTLDPNDDPVKCEFPNFLANEAVVLGNHKIVMQDYNQVLIVDQNDCSNKTMKIKALGIIPHDSSFFVIFKSRFQNEDLLQLDWYLSVRKYDDKGNFVKEFSNITQRIGELVFQAQFINATSRMINFFTIQEVSRYSSKWTVIDEFDSVFQRIKSEIVWPAAEAYSVAHGNLSVCYEKSGLRCILYDEYFQLLNYVVLTHKMSEISDNYVLINVHNLLGGGLIILFCEKVTDFMCRLCYAVIDEHGQIFENRSFGIESLYADDSIFDPFLMPINSVMKPKIFELHAEHAIYSFIFPKNGSMNGVSVTVRKISKILNH
ncbi:hypothetical protein QAD02_011907 [Eretmocerus hayati]|uniref:Uncharacterized protein n=1 Tax=Eretmocerus hayati TaxID=131215 RepID=A0ACC2NZV6_9HYME|nr:hypothetical protein QAD02_011907 [Eretmocerus hayati]